MCVRGGVGRCVCACVECEGWSGQVCVCVRVGGVGVTSVSQ